MTFVGKILVIIIMAFALFFLAISTVVFTTSENWKDKAAQINEEKSKLQAQKNDAETKLTAADATLKSEQDEFAQQKSMLEARITDLERQIEQDQQSLSEQREVVTTSQETMRRSMEEAEARKAETDQLRELLSSVQQQANEFKLRQTELNDTDPDSPAPARDRGEQQQGPARARGPVRERDPTGRALGRREHPPRQSHALRRMSKGRCCRSARTT